MRSELNLDDVLLRLNWEVDNECGPNAVFARLEADRILEGKVQEKRRGQFVRVCQDLGFDAQAIASLMQGVKWRG